MQIDRDRRGKKGANKNTIGERRERLQPRREVLFCVVPGERKQELMVGYNESKSHAMEDWKIFTSEKRQTGSYTHRKTHEPTDFNEVLFLYVPYLRPFLEPTISVLHHMLEIPLRYTFVSFYLLLYITNTTSTNFKDKSA